MIEENVVFSALGLVITDEQHRFGVKQRQALESKGKSPHVLIMTATPIPRTMALSVYGDLDVSFIKGMPPGRHPVKTYAVGSYMLQRIFRFMKKEMESGHQAYVVCPLVEQRKSRIWRCFVYENLRDHVPNLAWTGSRANENAEKEQVMEDLQR
ncbi:MAG: hypothetical protein ACLUIQ_11125 [Dialister invisus]